MPLQIHLSHLYPRLEPASGAIAPSVTAIPTLLLTIARVQQRADVEVEQELPGSVGRFVHGLAHAEAARDFRLADVAALLDGDLVVDDPDGGARVERSSGNPALDAKAQDCAARLGLAYERRFTGYGDLAVELSRVATRA